ncbi:Membrane-bound lytic murein transglycosylase F [Candidatus Magnetaquicoccaceae bacterium FCR-1]|uniref:Membrane-bound lytic murein transglycosylase F n=1 Tax=Candidatus Magnetaquiglobus chichijimensis TaxID=3141448 RepID=A0ABQ0C525_9PROT
MLWNPFSSVTAARFIDTRILADVNCPVSWSSLPEEPHDGGNTPSTPVTWTSRREFHVNRLTVLFWLTVAISIAPASARADTPLDRLITKIAIQENLDPDLLRAVVATESDFNNESVSPDGAIGLMQLMPETAKLVGVKNIHNPEQNLRGGARYLNQMLKQFPKIPHALAAYNAGPKMVERYQGVPPLTETQRYVGKVLDYYQKTANSKKRSLASRKHPGDKSIPTKQARLNKQDLPSRAAPPPSPNLMIQRTHAQARHDLVNPSANNGRRIPQFAMALSEPVDGESVPVLRAAQ